MNEPHLEPATCDVTPKIGCVQHDCDKCKAQAENNAELLRTVRAQAAEIESTWKLADAAEADNTQLRAELEAAKQFGRALEQQRNELRVELEAAKAEIDRLKLTIHHMKRPTQPNPEDGVMKL